MKLPRINDLDLVFTYARTTDCRATNLLFASLSRRIDLFQEEVIKTIVASPLYRHIMGNNSVVFPYEKTPFPILLATTELQEQVAERMENSRKGEAIIICQDGIPAKTIDLYTEYYACQLPQKLILGCSECVHKLSLAKGCVVRQTIRALEDNVEFLGLDPDTITSTTLLRSRQSKIGPFVYISPLLTAHKHFAKTIRTIEEHDFSYVEERATVREQIIHSRTRINAVKKNVCVNCCVQEECHREFDYGYLRHRIRNCSGRYPATEKELIQNIIKQNPPTMTYKQMSVLLANSGKLHKRYNRRICYATFTRPFDRQEKGPVFSIIARRHPWRIEHICKSYNEAIDILKKYNGYIQDVQMPMTPKRYALLLEATCHRYSPRSRNTWHVTAYPQLYIAPISDDGIEIRFTYNAHNKGLLPWSMAVRNFGTFIRNYYGLETQARISFPEEDLKLTRDRK